MEFRAQLTGLFNQLTDTDRQALHFVVGDKVPRKDRDDCTPVGSLHLLDSLFDRGLITEQNFDYLIHVLQKIHCFDAAQRLQDYKRKNSTSSASTLQSSGSSLLDETLSDIEQDKIQTYHHNNTRQDSYLYSISEEPSTESGQSMLQSDSNQSYSETFQLNEIDQKKLCSINEKVSFAKSHLYFIGLISGLIVLGVLCFILLSLVIKSSFKTQDSRKFSIAQERLHFIVKEGLEIGGNTRYQTELFNDAKDFKLSYADRCIGVEVIWSREILISIQFLYSNNLSPSHQSKDSLMMFSQFVSVFMLKEHEKINKINLYQRVNHTEFDLTGIQFHTTDGRKSDLFGSNRGHLVTESFEHYTFWYAKGRQQIRKRIDILQFVWVRLCSMSESIYSITRNMSEICEFTLVSEMDFKVVRAKGIESSWYDLKQKFNLQRSQGDSTALYYEKANKRRGPDIFAIVNSTSVFYHKNDEWYKYKSAEHITCRVTTRNDDDSSY